MTIDCQRAGGSPTRLAASCSGLGWKGCVTSGGYLATSTSQEKQSWPAYNRCAGNCSSFSVQLTAHILEQKGSRETQSLGGRGRRCGRGAGRAARRPGQRQQHLLD